MKIYKTFGELRSAPAEIYNYFMEMECHEPPNDERLLMEYYGGDTCIIETEEELKEIPTTIAADDDSRWLNITEIPDSYDACRWIADGKYVEIYMATTDAGGPSYYVPKEIADNCPNVLESIRLSTTLWS
jgi:hypothetical protein